MSTRTGLDGQNKDLAEIYKLLSSTGIDDDKSKVKAADKDGAPASAGSTSSSSSSSSSTSAAPTSQKDFLLNITQGKVGQKAPEASSKNVTSTGAEYEVATLQKSAYEDPQTSTVSFTLGTKFVVTAKQILTEDYYEHAIVYERRGRKYECFEYKTLKGVRRLESHAEGFVSACRKFASDKMTIEVWNKAYNKHEIAHSVECDEFHTGEIRYQDIYFAVTNGGKDLKDVGHEKNKIFLWIVDNKKLQGPTVIEFKDGFESFCFHERRLFVTDRNGDVSVMEEQGTRGNFQVVQTIPCISTGLQASRVEVSFSGDRMFVRSGFGDTLRIQILEWNEGSYKFVKNLQLNYNPETNPTEFDSGLLVQATSTGVEVHELGKDGFKPLKAWKTKDTYNLSVKDGVVYSTNVGGYMTIFHTFDLRAPDFLTRARLKSFSAQPAKAATSASDKGSDASRITISGGNKVVGKSDFKEQDQDD